MPSDLYVNKDISILVQVAFKAFIEVNKRMPKDDDWLEISRTAQAIWETSRSAVSALVGKLDAEESARVREQVEVQRKRLTMNQQAASRSSFSSPEINITEIPF